MAPAEKAEIGRVQSAIDELSALQQEIIASVGSSDYERLGCQLARRRELIRAVESGLEAIGSRPATGSYSAAPGDAELRRGVVDRLREVISRGGVIQDALLQSRARAQERIRSIEAGRSLLEHAARRPNVKGGWCDVTR